MYKNFRLFLLLFFKTLNYLRTENDLNEEDIRLVLDECNSEVLTYEVQPGIYTFKDLPEAPFRILQPEYEVFNNSVDIEFNDITMKTKMVVRPGKIAMMFDEKLFLVLFLVSVNIGTINTTIKILAKNCTLSYNR